MIIGERIKQLRKEKKLTQKELAENTGVSRESIVKYEKGERQPPADITSRIASALDVSTDYLLGRTDYPHISIEFNSNVIPEFRELMEKEKNNELTQDEYNRLREIGPNVANGVSRFKESLMPVLANAASSFKRDDFASSLTKITKILAPIKRWNDFLKSHDLTIESFEAITADYDALLEKHDFTHSEFLQFLIDLTNCVSEEAADNAPQD